MRVMRVVTCSAILAAFAPVPVGAIPAFARMHKMSCAVCHDPIPRLTPFGEMFVGNGYRFAPDQPLPDATPTGDRLLQLPEMLRLAIRVDAFATAYGGGKVMTDFQTPYNVKILSGGPLSESFSYYMYFMLFERGAVGGFEDAYVTWTRVAHTPVNLSVGQFQLSDIIFARELRLEYQDYVIYRARVGNSPSDLTYDRGLLITADVGGFALAGEMVNGNGNHEASASRRFDDDRNKSFLVHVSRDVLPGVTLGAMGYWTRQEGAPAEGPTARNALWMLGGDATVNLGALELRGQYLYREDASPTFTVGESRGITRGGFAEALWHRPGDRWYAIGLYNRVEANRPLLEVGLGGPAGLTRYQAVTGGLGYGVRRNVRVYVESTWDIEMRTTQWTAGMTLAF